MVWEKNVQSKRIEKQKKYGTLANLIAHTVSLSTQFLKHSYIKREQSQAFKMHDLPRATNAGYVFEALLQIDFAETWYVDHKMKCRVLIGISAN